MFKHLCVTNDAQFPMWERLIRSSNAPRSAGTPWAPRWAGKFVASGLSSPRKTKTPPKFRIGPNGQPNVTTCLFDYIARVRGLIDESAGLEWCNMKFGSVALPILRYNLGDAWLIEAIHLERHAGQMKRVRNHAQFPQA